LKRRVYMADFFGRLILSVLLLCIFVLITYTSITESPKHLTDWIKIPTPVPTAAPLRVIVEDDSPPLHLPMIRTQQE
jgi:hypothetical protein